jgi:hypothetical protein
MGIFKNPQEKLPHIKKYENSQGLRPSTWPQNWTFLHGHTRSTMVRALPVGKSIAFGTGARVPSQDYSLGRRN